MELKTIEKAIQVLKCFTEWDSSLGTTELAKKLGANKPAMSRILTTLKKHDFLEQEPGTRKYRLGPGIARIARSFNRYMNSGIVTVARPIIDKLRDEIGETIHLEVLSGNKIYLAYVAKTSNQVSLMVEVGYQSKPHVHAGAKAIVAFSESDEIERWLAGSLQKLNKNTITDREKLRELFQKIRKTGIAYDWQENLIGINAIAAPIFDHKDIAIAAITIVVPSYRMSKKWDSHFIEMLKDSANNISCGLQSSRVI